MDSALKELVNSGAVGAALAIVLAAVLWAFRALVKHLLEQLNHFTAYMDGLTKTLEAIRDNCRACRSDSVSSLRDMDAHVSDGLRTTIWAAHDKTVMALQKVGEETVRAIRLSNEESQVEKLRDELSRPHAMEPSGMVRR